MLLVCTSAPGRIGCRGALGPPIDLSTRRPLTYIRTWADCFKKYENKCPTIFLCREKVVYLYKLNNKQYEDYNPRYPGYPGPIRPTTSPIEIRADSYYYNAVRWLCVPNS